MQWRFQAMPWFQSWDASGFIRIPAAWWLISIGWVPLVWLVGRTRRVAYHYVHEIKSDYDEWQVTNSRIVSVSNDQCDQYWPIHSTDSKVQDPLHPAACAFGIRTNVPEDCLQERRTEWISSPMITDSTTDHGVCTPKEARSQTSPSPSEACHNFSKTIHRTINRTIKTIKRTINCRVSHVSECETGRTIRSSSSQSTELGCGTKRGWNLCTGLKTRHKWEASLEPLETFFLFNKT